MRDISEFETLRVIWTDLNGVARGIALSVDDDVRERVSEEGVGFANGVAELTLEPGLLDAPAYGPEGGDMLAVADFDSLTAVDWRPRTAAVFANLTDVDGTEFPLCARTALENVVEALATEGYVPRVGVESEFSLLRPDDEGGWEPYNTRCSYDMTAIDEAADHVETWGDAMEAAGYEVIGVHQESQPGQFEVNVKYDDALTTADGIMFLRHMVKATARQEGLRATFMPRPHTGEDANGMHFHLSLWDESGRENLFASEEGDLAFPAGKHPESASISEDARHFIGGLLEHMKALTAVCAPTVNSYKRLLPGIWAPVNIAWGPDNRSTVLRVPPELGPATRVEHRVPDTSSNPYLALAATLAAGLDGIRHEIDPGEPTLENAYHEDHERLPRTLWEALDHLEEDTVLRDALGETLVSEFVKLKRDEFDRYQDNVTDWERSQYMDEF